MKRVFSILSILLFSLVMLAGMTQAEDKGPAEIVLKSTVDPAKKAKPAFFPHARHQKKFVCATCHHSNGVDDKKVAYKEGQKIEKCDSCHNTTSGMIEPLNTFKKTAHTLCKGCHKELKQSGEAAGPTKCNGCHRKDLK